jgi:tRNA pseudouridine38-40 synthase
MRNLRIDLAYDGTDFAGWQVQPGARTVQGMIEEAFARITGGAHRIHGASRTDAGVHAELQVASVPTLHPIDLDRLHRGLEALTPPDLAVLSVREVPASFHARHSARGKTYRYLLWNAPLPSPFERRWAWHIRHALDVAAMRQAATHLLGIHDFSSFRAAGCASRSPVRELRRIDVSAEGPAVSVEVEGSSFLRGMVRNLVGTLVEVGRGKRPASATASILEARTRSAAGETAPARGLRLAEIRYEEACTEGGLST